MDLMLYFEEPTKLGTHNTYNIKELFYEFSYPRKLVLYETLNGCCSKLASLQI